MKKQVFLMVSEFRGFEKGQILTSHYNGKVKVLKVYRDNSFKRFTSKWLKIKWFIGYKLQVI